jgi:putative transposase
LSPRRRSEQALLAVVQQAYVYGVSTRRVDQLVESLGLRISRSEVSRVCEALDEHVEAFRTRPLEGRYPYLFLDAKVEKVRDGGRVVNKALVIAHGVHETGRREILGLDVGEAETEAFWTDFLRGLVARGLTGVQLAISDAHAALKAATAKVLGCAWQRCTVHFLRDCLGHARKDIISSVMRWLLRPLGPAGPPGGSRRTVERPTRISAASAGTRFRPTRTHTTLRDVTRSRPTAVGPAIRSQRASDKMRLVW